MCLQTGGIENHKKRSLASSKAYDVLISVVPRCNVSSTVPTFSNDTLTQTCSPGCSCNPLMLAVTSCALSKCSAVDRKPSWLPGQHQELLAAVDSGTGSSLLVTGQRDLT